MLSSQGRFFECLVHADRTRQVEDEDEDEDEDKYRRGWMAEADE
ncbi:MAG: hypothetical protein ACKV19_10250 [Verrucomicrobiales bacterium]